MPAPHPNPLKKNGHKKAQKPQKIRKHFVNFGPFCGYSCRPFDFDRRRGLRRLQVLQDFRQCRNNLKKIVNDAVVCDLEDRRLGVFINGDDAPRGLHSHQMLNRSRDAHSDI